MAYQSTLYGLSLSSNLPIPGLARREDIASSQVRIHVREKSECPPPIFSVPSEFFHTALNSNVEGQSVFRANRMSDGSFGFYYGDGARFAVKGDGSEVWADRPENYALED